MTYRRVDEAQRNPPNSAESIRINRIALTFIALASTALLPPPVWAQGATGAGVSAPGGGATAAPTAPTLQGPSIQTTPGGDAGQRPAIRNEFQDFVSQSVGRALPLFGYDLFTGVPTTFT